jgi:hypothetical protein
VLRPLVGDTSGGVVEIKLVGRKIQRLQGRVEVKKSTDRLHEGDVQLLCGLEVLKTHGDVCRGPELLEVRSDAFDVGDTASQVGMRGLKPEGEVQMERHRQANQCISCPGDDVFRPVQARAWLNHSFMKVSHTIGFSLTFALPPWPAGGRLHFQRHHHLAHLQRLQGRRAIPRLRTSMRPPWDSVRGPWLEPLTVGGRESIRRDGG